MNARKERPVLLNAEMVRAILSGRKTQTRRLVKPQPPDGHAWHGFNTYSTHKPDEGKAFWALGEFPLLRDAHRVRCPYGEPGDRLWVREAYQGCPQDFEASVLPLYAATDERTEAGWRPSIRMPRWASRITLEITVVRAERLQDISEEDAWAEGFRSRLPQPVEYAGWLTNTGRTSRDSFACLWESINGPNSWQANPWVWVVEFRRVEA